MVSLASAYYYSVLTKFPQAGGTMLLLFAFILLCTCFELYECPSYHRFRIIGEKSFQKKICNT